MNKRLYIAYGSYLASQQMNHKCPTAKPIAKGWIFDHRLVFQGNLHGAHANVIPEKGQDVPVVIWEITAADERALDDYLGGSYMKETMEIEVAGEMKEALIYVMPPRPYGIPADSYLASIVWGYNEFNFPIDILNEAVLHSQANTKYQHPAAQ